jgi:hypothetical protein
VSLNKKKRNMKLDRMNPRGSNKRQYPNKAIKVKKNFFQFSFFEISLSFNFSSFLNLFKKKENIRINPNSHRKVPEIKGKNPGPGVWKFPNFSLIDSIQILIPSMSQMKLSTITFFFI